MKEIVTTIKNLNASNWINLLLAGLLWYAYTTTEKRIARLEKSIARVVISKLKSIDKL